MECNLGKIDRTLRIVAGVSLIVWASMGGSVFGYAGIILLLTGLISFCPLYGLLGFNTGCKIKHES
ncbi:MAG: DUF2892 domain-containing protein [Sulfuricurvum sp.]|uniref:YgaP family membrane protein n=1 Tax=Sulfuricurvum sp. TaxID=2025608 RepID=UPI00271B3BFA|nr:DUF2892 domain-containing protein [Sulfuricurvum sp.]MDO9056998.1 DUF2892 domain-containing protein [Sulfuricurvum sp.]MDP3291708.1 DUF2892 domain-containing protein [Sulfuricurvum sp.]